MPSMRPQYKSASRKWAGPRMKEIRKAPVLAQPLKKRHHIPMPPTPQDAPVRVPVSSARTPHPITRDEDGPCAEESSLCAGTDTKQESQLRQWPCQIKLVHPNAPYFDNAHLLVAADCTAYAYAGIHSDFMKDRITIIGCPKLDHTDYSQKLAAILANNDIQSITVLRMEVPCCSGLVHAVRNAMLTSGKVIPWNVVTVSVDGNIVK